MKLKLLFLTLLIFLSTSTIAGIGTEGLGYDFTSGGLSATEKSGFRILVLENITLLNVTRFNGVTGNVVSIFNDSGTLLNASFFGGNTANLSYSLEANKYYRILVNTTSGAGWTHYCASPDLSTTLPITRKAIVWDNGTAFNETILRGDYVCNIETLTYSNDKVSSDVSYYNLSTYETDYISFLSNFTIANVSSVNLIYIGNSYSATVTSINSNSYSFFKALDATAKTSQLYNPNWYWNITYNNGTTISTNSLYQTLGYINLTYCGSAPQNVNYINFTFKNETTNQETVKASFISTLYYWLGTGSYNRSLSFTNTSENYQYSFCFTPAHRNLRTLASVTYDNLESEQRTYQSSPYLSLSNATTNKTLYLLPTSLGIFVTFQVINPADQAISGAYVQINSSTFGSIENKYTDSSGGATFFLNPLSSYTIIASASGYSTNSFNIVPSQSTYTIQLGVSTQNATDLSRGISTTILPTLGTVLINNTQYNFNLTLSSVFWNLDQFGFYLRNLTGSILNSTSSTTSTGGTVGVYLNTENLSQIIIDYYWIVNGTASNATAYWKVLDMSGNEWSLYVLFNDLSSYLSSGLFGLDDFGLTIIIFLVIFIFTGIFSYKFGLNDPAAILGILLALVLFFDVGLNLIPNPINAVSHFPTIFLIIVFIATVIWEATR